MLKAEYLKCNKSQQLHIKKETVTLLGYIDDEIRKAHDAGKTEIAIKLPINFSIPYMRNVDAQRKIYYNIITSLLNRNFQPKLYMKSDTTLLLVKWVTDEELEEVEIQNTLLAKFSKTV